MNGDNSIQINILILSEIGFIELIILLIKKIIERKSTTVATLTVSIMLRVCAQIAITSMAEPRNLGCVPMKSCMPVVCARIATLTNTIK